MFSWTYIISRVPSLIRLSIHFQMLETKCPQSRSYIEKMIQSKRYWYRKVIHVLPQEI